MSAVSDPNSRLMRSIGADGNRTASCAASREVAVMANRSAAFSAATNAEREETVMIRPLSSRATKSSTLTGLICFFVLSLHVGVMLGQGKPHCGSSACLAS